MQMAANDHATDASRLVRSLDRAVGIARAAQVLGWLGRTACVAVLACVIAAAIDRALRPAGLAWDGLAVAATTVAAAIAIWWRWIGRFPRRLDAAFAAEAAHPLLGERVSRAVEFLDAMDAGSSASRQLQQLAIAEAADAVHGIRRLPVPGLSRQIPWIIAGIAASAVFIAWAMVAQPGMEPDTQTPPAPQPALPAAVAAAGTRIAAAAALEAKLAAILASRFENAPGMQADALPTAEQRDLAQLAEIHRSVVRGIRDERAAIAPHAADVPGVQHALAALEPLGDEPAESVVEAIAMNRLAMAAAATARTALSLAAAARHLGGAVDTAAAVPAERQSPAAEDRRLAATLDEIAARPLGPAPTVGAAAMAPPTAAADGRPGIVPSMDGDGAARPRTEGVATTEPRFGSGAIGSDGGPAPAAAATPRDRVWSLLTAQSQPGEALDGEPQVPAEYRQAIDRYYTLLLESMTAGRPAPNRKAAP